MHVLILVSEVPGLEQDTSIDAECARDTFKTADAIQQGLASRGHEVVRVTIRQSMLDALEPYDPATWLVFNLCETLEGESYREPYVPAVLDALEYTYTGSDTLALHQALNKARTKARLVRHGVPTARYQVLESADGPIQVPLPALVKPVAEDGSIGVSDRAIVHTADDLREQVSYVLKVMSQPALVEEFIQGREFNVAIWGNHPPEVLPLAEIDYRHIADPYKQIISYAAKWDKSTYEYHHTDAICPAVVEERLAEKIRQAAMDAYRLMTCRDYARVDLRVRGQEPFVLEVNPNCDLAPDAGFAREARAAGYDHAAMVERIALFAIERRHSAAKR